MRKVVVLRFPPDLLKAVRAAAKRRSQSVNAYVQEVLRRQRGQS